MNQVIILIYVHIYIKSSKSQHLTIINPSVQPDNGQPAEAPSLLIDGVLHYMCKMGGPSTSTHSPLPLSKELRSWAELTWQQVVRHRPSN